MSIKYTQRFVRVFNNRAQFQMRISTTVVDKIDDFFFYQHLEHLEKNQKMNWDEVDFVNNAVAEETRMRNSPNEGCRTSALHCDVTLSLYSSLWLHFQSIHAHTQKNIYLAEKLLSNNLLSRNFSQVFTGIIIFNIESPGLMKQPDHLHFNK